MTENCEEEKKDLGPSKWPMTKRTREPKNSFKNQSPGSEERRELSNCLNGRIEDL